MSEQKEAKLPIGSQNLTASGNGNFYQAIAFNDCKSIPKSDSIILKTATKLIAELLKERRIHVSESARNSYFCFVGFCHNFLIKLEMIVNVNCCRECFSNL
jgi:hypothetical protein